MKIRILVLNGQRLIQIENSAGWDTEKVESANGVKPGIYNIYSASAVDKAKLQEGQVIHADREHIYQKVGMNVIKHRAADFEEQPAIGEVASIRYSNSKASISKNTAKRGRRI